MKTYATLTALSKDERETTMKTAVERGIAIASERTILQKEVAKTLVAMTESGEIEEGKLRKHAMKITGHDIRETLQNVYELVNVFQAVIKGAIALTEEEFDKLDASKLALLSPFMSKPELKEKLGEAVEAAKTGTAKDIRALKPKVEKSDDKPDEKPETTSIPVGFAATDIGPKDALIKSAQFKARIKSDLITALENEDTETIESIMEGFGKVFLVACQGLGVDPLDFIADTQAAKARPANGEVVEAPALEAAAA